MKTQKIKLSFNKGYVHVTLKINPKTLECWISDFKAYPKNQGLGTQALKLLNSYDYKPLFAYHVIVPAKSFWIKKLNEKLITGYTECNCKICQNLRRIEIDNYISNFILNSGTILSCPHLESDTK